MMLPLMLQPQPFFLSLLDCIWCNSSVQPEAVLQPFLNFRCSSANSIASSAPAASTLNLVVSPMFCTCRPCVLLTMSLPPQHLLDTHGALLD